MNCENCSIFRNKFSYILVKIQFLLGSKELLLSIIFEEKKKSEKMKIAIKVHEMYNYIN